MIKPIVSSPAVGRILAQSMGFTFVSTGEPNPPTVVPDNLKNIEAVVCFAADYIYGEERATGRHIDLVVSAGVHPEGFAAKCGESMAQRLAVKQNSPVDAIMVCRGDTVENIVQGLRAFRAGTRLTNRDMASALVDKRVLFTANTLEVRSLVTHLMRTALEPKLQGGKTPDVREGLIAGLFVPVVRDKTDEVLAKQVKIIGFPTTIYALALQEMTPRLKDRKLLSGLQLVFNENPAEVAFEPR